MSLSPSFKEELKRRLPIMDIVARRVKLVRRGDQATGLCPFHKEKSPSFHVYDRAEDSHYHCFGCGAHGDAISFVMETEGLDFREAIERLAAEAGLELPRSAPEEREAAERQAGLGTVLEMACRFFEAQLGGSAGARARDYLAQRGLGSEAIKRFRLGFAPDGYEALKAKLGKEQLPEALALEAGLLKRNEENGRVFDFFRGRVMFPIADAKGRTIAFGGRALGEEKPKYLNSPETPLFKKSRALYNIDKARKPAHDKGEIVVVEGYMDAIALAEAGFPQSVAPLGTALTEEHIAMLWRLAPEPILCFDGDEAGQKAASRAIERVLPLLRPGLSLRFAWMPSGLDPDDLVRIEGAPGLRQVLDRSQPLVEVLWQEKLAGRAFDTPERRAGFRRDLLAAVGRIADQGVAEDYRREMLARLDGQFAAAQTRFAPGRGRGPFSSRPTFQGQFASVAAKLGGEAARRGLGALRRLPYETLLAVLCNHPGLLQPHGEAVGLISIPEGKLDRLKGALLDLAARAADLDRDAVRDYLGNLGFSETVQSLTQRAGVNTFSRPEASPEDAERGLLHLIAMLRGAEIEAEWKAAGRDLAADASEENLARFEAERQLRLEAEKYRRDLDEWDEQA